MDIGSVELANHLEQVAATQSVMAERFKSETFWSIIRPDKAPTYWQLPDAARDGIDALVDAVPALLPLTPQDIAEDAPGDFWNGLAAVFNKHLTAQQGYVPQYALLNHNVQSAIRALLHGVPRLPELFALCREAMTGADHVD